MNVEKTLTTIQQVVTIVIIPVVMALLPTVKRFIDAHTTVKQRQEIESIANTAVHAVEQLNPNLSGDGKYLIAAQKINEVLGNKLTPKQLDDLIESTVNQMNIALGKSPKPKDDTTIESTASVESPIQPVVITPILKYVTVDGIELQPITQPNTSTTV